MSNVLELTQNKKALVDQQHYDHLNQYTWSYVAKGYAKRTVYDKETQKERTVLVHRYIYETFVGPIPSGYLITHANGDNLNNTVANLKLVSRKENAVNKKSVSDPVTDS
jgi:hypothetical protein